jgi:hypothetical protein
MSNIDYVTPAERLSPPPLTLEQKRLIALEELKGRGKWLMDPKAPWRTGEAWRPTHSTATNVKETFARAQQADMLVMLEAERLPALMRRQAT